MSTLCIRSTECLRNIYLTSSSLSLMASISDELDVPVPDVPEMPELIETARERFALLALNLGKSEAIELISSTS